MSDGSPPKDVSDDALLFVMQALLRALTFAFEEDHPNDPSAARQAASEHIGKCLANPAMMAACMEGLPEAERTHVAREIERHRAAFAEALMPGVGTPNAFNL